MGGFFDDPGRWLNSAANDISAAIGTDRSDSFLGHIGEVLATDKTAQLAAAAVAIYFGLPYVPGGPELAAYASEMASAGGAAGAGGVTADAALAQAGATTADLVTAASTAGAAEAAGAGAAGAAGTAAMTPAALESLAGTAGYGVNAAAGAGSGLGAYATNLGATTAGAAGAAGAASSTPWYLSPSVISGAASLGSGLIGAYGANKAADTSAAASANALALQKDIYGQQTALNAPYNAAGLAAQNKMLSVLGLGGNTAAPGYGQYAKDFSMADYQADPGYAFRLSEGLKQLRGAAAARGGAVSGSTMKGIQDYAQNSASQEYQNAYNRYQQNRTNQLQPLGNLMSSGQAAANQQSNAAGNYGTTAANLMTNAGNVAGSAQLGAATTIGNALNTGATAYQNQTNFNNWLAQNQSASAYNPPKTVGS